MLKSNYFWVYEKHDDFAPLGIYHPEIEKLFLNRKLGTKEQLLDSETSDVWHDPYQFCDMKKVVDRIFEATRKSEKIMIYGDYDADGTTSTALLLKTLREFNAYVDFYIPHRIYEGYGPNEEAFMEFVDQGYSLIITVDCGISAINEAQVLKENNVDLIIIDHHHPKEEIPYALGIIHPEFDNNYPFDFLAGAGTTLKVVEALKDGKLSDEDYMLAMLGTVGDIVDLIDENRTLVKRGLNALRVTKNKGILSILKLLDISSYEADETTVGFAICPRLNAPGRMDEAGIVVDLLLSNESEEVVELAGIVEAMNIERKTMTQEITEQALEMIQNKEIKNLKVVILYSPDWHEGLLGIVASRIVDKTGVAAIVLTRNDEGLLKGSARSPIGIDIISALMQNEKYLYKYGGHPLAAGLTMANDKVEEFEKSLNEVLANSNPQLNKEVDLILDLKDIDFKIIDDINVLAPFGQANQKPIVQLNNIQITNLKKIGATKEHLKFQVKNNQIAIDAIFFNGASNLIFLTENTTFDIICYIEVNTWNSKSNIQLRVVDIRSDDFQIIDIRNQQLFKQYASSLPAMFEIDNNYNNLTDLKQAYLQSKEKTVMIKPVTTLNMPKRNQFVQVYKIIHKQAPFSLNQAVVDYFEREHISKGMLVFIIKVFEEVGILEVKNGILNVLPTTKKVDYTTSMMYQKRISKVQLSEFLEFASVEQIRDFLTKIEEIK